MLVSSAAQTQVPDGKTACIIASCTTLESVAFMDAITIALSSSNYIPVTSLDCTTDLNSPTLSRLEQSIYPIGFTIKDLISQSFIEADF